MWHIAIWKFQLPVHVIVFCLTVDELMFTLGENFVIHPSRRDGREKPMRYEYGPIYMMYIGRIFITVVNL